jgi:hypothetical protein
MNEMPEQKGDIMTESKFTVPDEYRDFNNTNLPARLETARRFVIGFARYCAPAKSEDDSDEAWTRSVRKRFIDMCPDDCYPLPADPLSRTGEYLVDYTWSEHEKGKRIILAAESEWGTGWYTQTYWEPVEHDFEKLLGIKAPVKVLIFGSVLNSRDQDPGMNFSAQFALMRLTKSLQNYGHHLPGEVYIFIDLPQTGNPASNGVFRSWAWISGAFGLQKVDIKPLEDGDLVRSTPGT